MSADRYLGLDLGGTYLKSAVLDHAGEVLHRSIAPSAAERGVDAAYAALLTELERYAGPEFETVRAIGLGMPGPVDRRSGHSTGATPHLRGIEGRDVARELGARSGRPVFVDNDANGALRAELMRGAARGADSALMVLIGTGVGAGLAFGGAVWSGARGGAGEIGHWPIGTGDLPCRCGVLGCAEPEMSAGGLRRRAERDRLPWSEWLDVFAAERGGDARAAALADALVDRLGATIAIALHLIDPSRVVVGGGVSTVAGFPLERIRAATQKHLQAGLRPGPVIVAAEHGIYSGAIGAALLAMESIGDVGLAATPAHDG